MKKSLRKIRSYSSNIRNVIVFGSVLFSASVYAFDTDDIPDVPVSSISLLDNETYDFGGRTIDGSNISDNGLFRCMNRRGVTIKNVTVTGSPRYAIFARGCSSFKIENFKMVNNPDSVSRNGSIDKVSGYRNDQDGGYATLRFANNAGPNLSVGEVFSRDSGRGFFTVSGAKGITVSKVDAHRSNREAIYIQDSDDVSVGRGIARSNGTANCRIRGSDGVSLGSVDCGGSIAN